MRLVLLSATDLAYTSYAYTHSDILLFAYTDGTVFEVYYSSGALLWTGTLNAGQHYALSPGAGVYLIAASSAFSVNVGDALTGFVLGYYAMDQNGKGLSTLFYTYQSYWGSYRIFDPHFIIFAYEDNTQVTLKSTTTNQTLWSGTLNNGQHYDDPNLSGEYVTVSSSRPVAALSYTDQGYYVPASNGTFVGTKFHTYVGNSGEWAEDLNLIAYENASITVSDSATKAIIWAGILNAGQVFSLSNLNGRYVTISATANVAVSVSPFTSWSGGRYYHSLYGQDSSGTGIGTYFLFPAIPTSSDVTCRLTLFSYVDNANVTVNDSSGTTVWQGVLNRAQSQTLYPAYTVYRITSNGSISALLDCGDDAGADFAPVYYAALNVDVTSPVGQSYRNYGSVFVSAIVQRNGQPLLGATVAGQIVPVMGGEALEFELNDRGLSGDPTAGDGQYAATISLLGPARMPPGNYFLLVSAQKSIDGQLASGSGSSIFSVTGAPSGALSVNPTLTCPHDTLVYVGDTCTVSLLVTYPDSQIHSDGIAALTLHQPDLTEKRVNLSYVGSNTWQGNINITLAGRYLLDFEAQPIWGSPYIGGYASAVVDTLKSAEPLVIVPQNLPNTFHQNQLVVFSVNVSQAGTPLSGATVQAVIDPDGEVMRLSSIGGGLYSGVYQARSAGSYSINFEAMSPFYRTGTATSSFSVDTVSANLIDTVVRASGENAAQLNKMKEYALHVAQDGDWFQSKVKPDEYKRQFDLIVNVISLGISGLDAAKALSQAATKSTAPVAARFTGLNLFEWLEGKLSTSIDGRVFRSWATRLTNATRSGLLVNYLKYHDFPPYIGWGVLRRAAVYYAAKITGQAMDNIAIDQVGQFLAGRRQSNERFLQDEEYPYFAQSADEDAGLVSEYAQAIQLDPPAVSSAVEGALVKDIGLRMRFDQSLVDDTQQRNGNLWTAHELRVEEDDPFSIASILSYGKTLLKVTLPIVAGIACGGPVGAGVGVVIAVETIIEDWNHDTEHLTMDNQMSGFAFGSMQTMLDTKETLTENIESGLASVRRGTMPAVPGGTITSVHEEIQTEYFLFEKRVVTSMTIYNNSGTTGAYFNVRAFGDKTGWLGRKTEYYWVDVVDDLSTWEKNVGWIYLAPYESRNVQVVWKDKDRNGLDMRPNDGSKINLYLTAQTLEGQYVVHQHSYRFNTPAVSALAAAQTSYSQPILSYPVSEQVGRDRFGDEYTVNIRVQNPLPYPASMVVTQTIPDGIKVLSPGGGMTSGDNIQWQRVVQPHETFEFKLNVQNSLGGTSVITMSASTATFYVSQSLSELTFTGTPVVIAAPKRPTVYLPLVVRNFSAAPTDTYEPNNTLSQAYGPLTSGANYVSYLSSNTDLDYYYFDISTLGRVTVDLSNIGAPGSDYDLFLYNTSGQWLGSSAGAAATERIEFQPASTGRYYILVYPYSGADPARPYYLNVQYNGALGAGDIYGTVYANGSPKSNVPISLNFYDYNTDEYRTTWGMTNGAGQYHFRGMSTLGANQIYYVYYGGGLGSSYIGYWYSSDLTSYTAGTTVFAANPDISPLNLGTPNSTTGIPLPITFTWTPRATSPSETYYVYLYDPSNSSTYYWSSSLGHAGNFTLYGLPSGFTTGHTYRWRVYAYGTDGSGSGSYYTNNVAFSSTGAVVYSAPAPVERIPREQMQPDRDKQERIPARP